jgi:CRISPR type IV-associated protein Csf3
MKPTKTPKGQPDAPPAPRQYTTQTFPWAGLALPPALPAPSPRAHTVEVVREPHHRPLVATARLRDGVVNYDTIHLDGLVQFAAMRQHIANGGEPLPDPNITDTPLDIPIPMARWAVAPMDGERVALRMMDGGRLWGWCASGMVMRVGAHTQIEVRKRTPLAEMTLWGSDKSVNTAAGPHKPWDTARPKVVPADYRVHFFGLGDVDRVRALLQGWITHLGKLSTQGNGAIVEWIVEEVNHDYSIFGPQGQPMRNLPARAVPGCAPKMDRIRTPYWHNATSCLCAPWSPLHPRDLGLPDPVAMLPRPAFSPSLPAPKEPHA